MGIIFVVKLAASLIFCARSVESHWQCQVMMLVPHVVLAVLRPPWPVPGLGGVCPFMLVPIPLGWPGSGPDVGAGDLAPTAACPCPELAMGSTGVTEEPGLRPPGCHKL